ncbi:Peptidylprolyl isomerase [Aphelenchoides fujianensis]|nr:Peptidylprolyl isomerase [Aphelenchoides fujianensis]
MATRKVERINGNKRVNQPFAQTFLFTCPVQPPVRPRTPAKSRLFACVQAGLEDVGETGLGRKRPEDSIPVIEIRGEGKPMTAAQIRQLEEISNGGPLDIKVEKTWVPVKCPRAAKRLDFVTFHYKGFLEDGKKFDQTYGRGPVKIQLGTGMVIPGLDKGENPPLAFSQPLFVQDCEECAIRSCGRSTFPYRLSRKNKSKVWKHIPNDEHWLRFDVEMLTVEEWTIRGQFVYMDTNNDSRLTENELVNGLERQRKDYGKNWRNEDIDNVLAVRYYIKYFDANRDGKIDYSEFQRVMQRDLDQMEEAKASRTEVADSKAAQAKGAGKQRGRDPGVAWILDFNNDGLVSFDEQDTADRVLQEAPRLLPLFDDQKDEL